MREIRDAQQQLRLAAFGGGGFFVESPDFLAGLLHFSLDVGGVFPLAAESADLIVLHYDRDYDLISEVTGQVVEWVVPRGSV